MKILPYFILLCLVAAKSDKVCGKESLVPFSGFKVVRQYKLSLSKFKPQSQQFMSLVHCSKGKAEYQKTFKVDSLTSFNWERPFCFYKPKLGSYLPEQDEDTVNRLAAKRVPIGNITATTTKPNKFKLYIRGKIDMVLETIFGDDGLIHYTGKQKNDHLKDIELSPISASMEWESRHLVCYKLARRKKYAKRDLSFYIPLTFIGALYECHIPAEEKKKLLQAKVIGAISMSFDFQCDPRLSNPIMPLMADSPSSQWWDIKKDPFSPSAFHNVPYLTTSNPFNLRFGWPETPEMGEDTWASKIKVNEDYDYSDLDVHVISLAIESTADLIYKLLKPIDFSRLFKDQDNLRDLNGLGKPLSESDLLINKLRELNNDQKLGVLMSLKPLKFLEITEKLQRAWESLTSEII